MMALRQAPIFAYGNLITEAATIVAASATGFDAIRAANDQRGVHWRSTTLPATYRVTFSEAQAFSAMGLVDHNFSESAVVSLYGSNDAWASESLIAEDTPIADPWVKTFDDQSFASIEYRFADAANADGYANIGRLFLGPVAQLEYTHTFPESDDPVDPTIVTPQRNGTESFDVLPNRRVIPLVFDRVPFEDRDRVRAVSDACNIWAPFLFQLNPTDYPGVWRFMRFQSKPVLPQTIHLRCSYSFTLLEWL